MSAARLNADETNVLNVLTDGVDPDAPFRDFGFLSNRTGLDRKAVRRACRSLTRKGLAQFGRGLWDPYEGTPRGSGYAATEAGVAEAAA